MVGSLLVGSVAAFLIVVALTPSDVQISTGEKVIFIINIPQSSCAEPPCPPGSRGCCDGRGIWPASTRSGGSVLLSRLFCIAVSTTAQDALFFRA